MIVCMYMFKKDVTTQSPTCWPTSLPLLLVHVHTQLFIMTCKGRFMQVCAPQRLLSRVAPGWSGYILASSILVARTGYKLTDRILTCRNDTA